MSELKTFLYTHEYSKDLSILFEDKYVTLLETYMKSNNQITLIWGGPLIYQIAYTGFCELKDYLYSSHISHSCFTKIKYNSMNHIKSSLKPLSSFLVDLENYLNKQKQLNNWSDYELNKYDVTIKRINAQKMRTIKFENLTIHLLSISDSIFYLEQILEYKYKHNILKAYPEQETLERETLDYYDKKFNNKPTFSIAYTPSAEPYTPTPGPGKTPRRFVIYADTHGVQWHNPIGLVGAESTEYTHIIAAFYIPSSLGNWTSADFVKLVINPNPSIGCPEWIKTMRANKKKVMISIGGEAAVFTSASQYQQYNPVNLATNIASIIKKVALDGVDIDWEDDYTNKNPGLTGFGPLTTRVPGTGPAVQWLITLTTELRMKLPRPYIITHAPQASYFDMGYEKIWKGCGKDIDWLNVQFYNQGKSAYSDVSSLVYKNTFLGPDLDGSITDINNKGVPPEKIIVGKGIMKDDLAPDGQPAWTDTSDTQALLVAAVKQFPSLGGAMGWQWGSDCTIPSTTCTGTSPTGTWIKTLKTAFHTGPTPPPSPTPPTPAPTPPPIPPTPPPTPVPGPSPSKVCHSINQQKVSNNWCITNCNHIPPSCPSDLCKCN